MPLPKMRLMPFKKKIEQKKKKNPEKLLKAEPKL
tara:strand:+ start:443 stop:544 length:102 start_codon:yes stop_codon:yes gene_type:complete